MNLQALNRRRLLALTGTAAVATLVDRPYPRRRDDSRLLELRQHALELLGQGSDW